MSQVDLAHPPCPQPRYQLIGVHDTATQVVTDARLEHQDSRGLQEGRDTIGCRQQSIDPRAQRGVASARLGKIGLAFGVFAGQRAFEDALATGASVR